jgi:cob(I)alamin adenosyltransferase
MKSNLYTRTGDQGTTSLVGGERVKKNSVRLEAYGTIDELSSHLGVVAAHRNCDALVGRHLQKVQNELFNLGSYLATAPVEGTEPKCVSEDTILELESWIDLLDEKTPKIRAFILPGGSPLAAETHVARTVCRRAERRIFELAEEAYVDPALIRYVNRLSDYLFIAARYLNHMQDVEEIVWKK